MASSREPVFNIPPVVLAAIAAMALVHAVRVWIFPPEADARFLLLFAFFPARYYPPSFMPQIVWPGGWPADIWTFVSYAFIHGDWMHFGLNAVWLLAFGSAVARRFGTLRFAGFFAITAAAGAAAHLVTHPGEVWPMVGASAAISGYMAAAMRFVFQIRGPLVRQAGSPQAYLQPAAPLAVALRDPRVLVFLGAWFALNLLFGVTSFAMMDDNQSIAWQAHIGGFLAGLLLFPLFDPVRGGEAGSPETPEAESL